MTSQIPLHSTAIDTAYPIPGINQSSQGFRSNFTAIKAGLDQGATEISNLQAKVIAVTGDVSGTTSAFGTNSAPIALSLVFPTQVGVTAGTYSSLTKDVVATINSKGLVTGFTVTDLVTNVDPSQTYTVDVTAMGSGTGTANFPTFKYDSAGRVAVQGTKAVTFGLLGHPAGRGTVVAGNSTSQSAITPAPATFDSTRVLMATGNGPTGLEWIQLVIPGGTITTILEGPGIDITPSSSTPTVTLDIGSLADDNTIADADSLAYHDFINNNTRRLTVADFKSFLAQDFLAADTGDTEITSSDLGGVIFNSPNGITFNGLKWPADLTPDVGQVLTVSTGGNLVWEGSSNALVTRTFYVSDQYGSDTTGTGGMTTPYKTITQALGIVPDNGIVYTVALLAGTYLENVEITAPNVIIKGIGGVSKPILKGVVTIGADTNFIGLENLKLDRSDEDLTELEPALFGSEGLGSLQVLDCDFIRGSGAKAQLPIVGLGGALVTGALFDGCSFQGQVELELAAAGDVRAVVSNVRHLGTREFGFKIGGNALLSNIPVITAITHTAGNLTIENVGVIVAKTMSTTIPDPLVYQVDGSNDAVLQAGPIAVDPPMLVLDPDGKPIQNAGLFGPDGVTPLWKTTAFLQAYDTPTSTTASRLAGVYSTAATGSLVMHDVGLLANGSYAPIIKAGNAEWMFTNVERRADKDVIFGPRIAIDAQVDAGDFMPRYEIDSTSLRYAADDSDVPGGKLDPQRSKMAHVTLVGSNSHITLKTPLETSFAGDAADAGEQVVEFKVFVQQDSTGGRTVKWSTDTAPTIIWYSDYLVDDAPNAITIYTFYYHSVARQWIGMKTSKNQDRHNVFTGTGTTFVPTLQHANSFISISNAAGIGFQINGSLYNFPIGTWFEIEQAGAGTVTLSGVGGQNVLVRTGSTATAGQYAVIKVTKRSATDWIVSGDHS